MLCVCDVTGSRDVLVHHYKFHLWMSLGQLGSVRGGGWGQPGATENGLCLPGPYTHHLSLDFLLSSWLRGTRALQSSSPCDLVRVGVGFFPRTFLKGRGRFFAGTSLRWGRAYFLIVPHSWGFMSVTP